MSEHPSILDRASDLRNLQANLREQCTDLRRRFPDADAATPYDLANDAVRMVELSIQAAINAVLNARSYVREQEKRYEAIQKAAASKGGAG